ncbi:hypothetical protein BFW01_g8151 [Lasiodiplodia theobromae]|uniref:tRNA uridine 5-carboxymethylaminomethyl modification enzyme GidA n=1 Tax=Lasiodiplodia theobromae TaxID=45133 RepID=UPI0015C364FD|nr:tRNA uridine 5-carboxymethylaminomethyl modification enzyme GidA [Lasiodiplodia theobromae]KAF4535719.1 tRNA uridine 5-carboxymethylaminomethyl modification enzyme GidA [Lasiodiplodia theobromae]KAF9637255.1 hypothetical protein BFW01_g8151 [Lasiodiplodia theobromae]
MRATYIVPALLALATPLLAVPTPMAQPDGGAAVDVNADFANQLQVELAKAADSVAAGIVAKAHAQHKKRTYQSPGVNVGAGAGAGVNTGNNGLGLVVGTNVNALVDGIIGLKLGGVAGLGVGKGKDKREPGVDPRALLGVTVGACVETFLGHLVAGLQVAL